MKTNITIKVDAKLASEAKILAAKKGSSLSRMVAAQLKNIVDSESAYENACDSALRRLKRGFDLNWEKPVNREDLHER